VCRWREVIEDAGFTGVEFGPAVDTFEGASGEENARTFGTFGYPIRARKPDEGG
jgi:hypothetical protein